MSIRLVLVAAVLYFVPITVVANMLEITSLEQSATVGEEEEFSLDSDQPETVMRRQSLAVHLGLTPADVVFGEPRNFRTESLNYFKLEPLYEAEEN